MLLGSCSLLADEVVPVHCDPNSQDRPLTSKLERNRLLHHMLMSTELYGAVCGGCPGIRDAGYCCTLIESQQGPLSLEFFFLLLNSIQKSEYTPDSSSVSMLYVLQKNYISTLILPFNLSIKKQQTIPIISYHSPFVNDLEFFIMCCLSTSA